MYRLSYIFTKIVKNTLMTSLGSLYLLYLCIMFFASVGLCEVLHMPREFHSLFFVLMMVITGYGFFRIFMKGVMK